MVNIIFILLIIFLALYSSFKIFHRYIFLRDPERVIPTGENIVSPADGKVVEIITLPAMQTTIRKGILGKIHTLTKDLGDEVHIISIFMSPMNVHVNRAPITGIVKKIVYKPGKFLPVQTFENGLVNEKNEILITNKKEKVKMIQIAGFLARRIECHVKEGQAVKKGERVGLINLGSQVTLIFPGSREIQVKKGQKVTAGETIIAR